MTYLGTAEIAKQWDVSPRWVRQWCSEGKIPGVRLVGKSWQIPSDAEKPLDRRTREGKQSTATVDRVYLLMNTEYSRQAAALTENERQLCEIQDLYLQGDLAQADLLLQRFLTQCHDSGYLVVALMLLYAIHTYRGTVQDRMLIEFQLHDLLQTGRYPFSQIYIQLYRNSRNPDIPNLNLPQEVIPLLYYRSERNRFIQMLRRQQYVSSTVLEINCRIMESLGNEAVVAYYHSSLAMYYRYANQKDLYEVHRRKALDLILSHGWYLILAQHAFSIDWQLEQYLDAETLQQVRDLTESLCHSLLDLISAGQTERYKKLDAFLLLQILFLVSCRRTNDDIAYQLGISLYLVKKYISAIYELTGNTNREEVSEPLLTLIATM